MWPLLTLLVLSALGAVVSSFTLALKSDPNDNQIVIVKIACGLCAGIAFYEPYNFYRTLSGLYFRTGDQVAELLQSPLLIAAGVAGLLILVSGQKRASAVFAIVTVWFSGPLFEVNSFYRYSSPIDSLLDPSPSWWCLGLLLPPIAYSALYKLMSLSR